MTPTTTTPPVPSRQTQMARALRGGFGAAALARLVELSGDHGTEVALLDAAVAAEVAQ